MGKNKKKSSNSECFDEFDYIYYEALDTAEQQRNDIKKLIILLIEYDIPIPDDIINKYLKKDSYIDNISEEDLPF